MVTDWELVHKLYDIHLYLFVTSINVFCALGLCSRVLLLKILQTKRFSCDETVLKTHKKNVYKKKKKHGTLYTGLSAVSTVLSWKRVDMLITGNRLGTGPQPVQYLSLPFPRSKAATRSMCFCNLSAEPQKYPAV